MNTNFTWNTSYEYSILLILRTNQLCIGVSFSEHVGNWPRRRLSESRNLTRKSPKCILELSLDLVLYSETCTGLEGGRASESFSTCPFHSYRPKRNMCFQLKSVKKIAPLIKFGRIIALLCALFWLKVSFQSK